MTCSERYDMVAKYINFGLGKQYVATEKLKGPIMKAFRSGRSQICTGSIELR